MSKYKAIVIDGKKLLRRITALGTAAVVAAVCILNTRLAGIKPNLGSILNTEGIISESLPVFHAANTDSAKLGEKALTLGSKLLSFLLTFDPSDPRTVIFGHLPLIKAVSGGYLASAANADVVQVFNPADADKGVGNPEPPSPQNGVYPITEVDSSQNTSKSKIQIRNETQFSINIDEMLKAPLGFDLSGDGPQILIVHTHATECYSPEGASTYLADKGDRSDNPDQNMIAVGNAAEKVFKNHGIEVLHDKTLHDKPSFNLSYANSLKTVEGYLAKYPSIKVVLDLHRDAFVYENGGKAKFVTEIKGQKTAQLMLVVGTNSGGLDHPNWRENMKLALKLQKTISDKYPNLMRGVNLRKERFNGHTTTGSLIIEVGSSGNTLNEAIRGITLAAEEMSKFFID